MNNTLLSYNRSSETETKSWYALYVRFKSEKLVQKHLEAQGVEAYVPLLRRTKRYTRKIKHYEIPLIGCYVFVRIDARQHASALQAPHVLGYVRQAKEKARIPDHEIDLLKQITGELYPLELVQTQYETGDWVEIIQGQLTGLKGKIIKTLGKKGMLIELEHIGIALRLEVDPAHIRPLPRYRLA